MNGKEIIANSHFGSVSPSYLVIATSETVGAAQDKMAVAIDEFLSKVERNVSQTPEITSDRLDLLVGPRAEKIMRDIVGNDGQLVQIISADVRHYERAQYTEIVNAIRSEARRILSIVRYEAKQR